MKLPLPFHLIEYIYICPDYVFIVPTYTLMLFITYSKQKIGIMMEGQTMQM